jgi:outer membrane protein assembly factor BamA
VGFEGERWSRERILARTAGMAAGEPYSSALVGRARSRLFGFGAFSRVTAETVRDAETGAARVTFSLTERPRFRFAYGLHWSSETGSAAVVDFIDQNFLGRGLTFGVRGLYEPDDLSGRLYFSARELWGSLFSFESFLLVRRQFPEEGFVEDTQEAALQLSRPLGSQLDGRLYLRYRRSRFFEEEPDPFFPIDLEIANPYVGTGLVYDARNDAIDPRRGLLASADLTVTGPWLGGDFDYARLFTQVAAHRDLALGGRPFGWAGSVRVGLARAFGGQELLRVERFFAGGELSVRGYPSEGLGPQEVLGDLVRPLGGEALLVVNQELRLRLPFDLTGLVFFDAGQVWSEVNDFGSGLAKSLGLGLRAWTPLGLVRFDAGFPLDRRPGDDRYRLYLGLGNAF